MQEENILGHIISKDGIRIDRDRVKEIMKVELPRSKNQVHPFISQVNFLRRFILNFVEILRSVTNMLRNDSDIKWTVEANKYFTNINKGITEAPVLFSPNILKYFIVFSFFFWSYCSWSVVTEKSTEYRTTHFLF